LLLNQKLVYAFTQFHPNSPVHNGTDQQMTIAKTWFGDNGIYICVRADIQEAPLKSKEGEYECRL